MKEKYMEWGKKIAKAIGFILAVVLVFYILVFHFSFLPKGYNIDYEKDGETIVKAYSIVGTVKHTYHFSPQGEDSWAIGELQNLIKGQKNWYVVLFSALIITSTYMNQLIKKGKKIGRAIFDSFLIFAIAIPITLIGKYFTLIEVLLETFGS